MRRHRAAALYKWTDAQGRIVYSDQPPPANVKTEQLRAPPPAANPNAAKEFAQREAEYRRSQTDAAEAAAKADKERVDARQARRGLRAGAGQLKQLAESQLAIYRYNEKGEREVMDDDARGRRAREAQRVHPRHQVPRPRDAGAHDPRYGFFSSIAWLILTSLSAFRLAR